MNKIFTTSADHELGNFSLEEALIVKTHGASEYIRSSSIILIGLNMHQDYPACRDFLLSEMQEKIHFEKPVVGICSGWTLAIILAENLRWEDYPLLRKEFVQWTTSEQEGLLEWLHGFRDQQEILKFGKITS